MSLYAENGITATRSSAVAEAAGVAHGTLFFHFPTQEDLIAAVIEEFGKGLCGRLHEMARHGDNLETLLGAHLAAIAEREDFYARLVTESSVLPQAARTSLVMIQSTASFHLARAAEADMAGGFLRRQPFHLLFNTWVGLVHHYIANRELFAPDASVIALRGAELLGYFMSLVKGG